jgi:hypothetical protein
MIAIFLTNYKAKKSEETKEKRSLFFLFRLSGFKDEAICMNKSPFFKIPLKPYRVIKLF